MINKIKRFFVVKRTELRIAMKYQKLFSFQRRSIKLGEKTLLDKSMHWKPTENFRNLCICMLAMSLTKMRSIHLLCKKGFAKDATILSRVLFEDLVIFNYIDNDKISRLQDFIDYGIYQRLKLRDIIPNNTDQISKYDQNLSDRTAELEAEWDKIKHRFIRKDGKKFRNWCDKSLEEIAKNLKIESTYNFLYRYLSHYVHLTPLTFNDYILGKDKKGILVEIGTSEQFVPEVLATANAIFVDWLIKAINDNFKIGLDKEIEELAISIKNTKTN